MCYQSCRMYICIYLLLVYIWGVNKGLQGQMFLKHLFKLMIWWRTSSFIWEKWTKAESSNVTGYRCACRCCCAVRLVCACVYMSVHVCVCVCKHACDYACLCLLSLRSAALNPAAGKLKLVFMPELDALSVRAVGGDSTYPHPHLQPPTTTSNKTIHC